MGNDRRQQLHHNGSGGSHGQFELNSAGLPISVSETHTKNQFANEPEGTRQFRDHHWKVLGEKSSDLPSIFFCNHFLNS